MNLENKVVVVTGGSAGLGEQICYEAAKRGAIVVTCARRTNLIGKVKEQCMELSGKEAYAFQLDVANPESVERLLEKSMKKLVRSMSSSIMLATGSFKNLQRWTRRSSEICSKSMFLA